MVYPDRERVSGPRISIRKLPNEARIHNDPGGVDAVYGVDGYW